MIKKAKATSKEPATKPAKKASPKAKKPKDLAEARKNITEIVRAEATKMARAVMVEALKGQLAHMKYLFEVSGLYPANLGAEAKPGEDSLAATLLKRMGLPIDPAKSEEGEMPGKPGSEPSDAADEKSGEKDSGGPVQAEGRDGESGSSGVQNPAVVLS